MSKKADIIEMIENGESNDSIVEDIGCKLSYIRNIRSSLKKTETTPEPEEPETKESESLTFDGFEKEEVEEVKPDTNAKSGSQYHKQWVKEAKYQCACGCTLNKKGKFCPNCGNELNWEGF